MTGIERLEGMSMAFASYAWGASLSEALGDIAAQIAREHAEDCFRMGERAADVSMSAYDLLPEEEREAIAWVREHGGLDAVKRHWKGYVPAAWLEEAKSRHKQRRDRLKAHAWELECKCAERRETIEELGKTIDEMRPRLMPEGMEWLVEAWPRFEDGAPLKFGDMAIIDGEADMVEAVQLWIHGKPVIYGDGGSQQLERGERVKRPAPKVLDADGAEIRVGDEVWTTRDLDKFTVTNPNNGKFLSVSCKGEDGEDYCCYPTDLTHRAPVLAADGRPLREGETVYHVADGRAFVVREVREDGALVEPVDGRPCGRCRADYLTHERPDSWERLEEDAGKLAEAEINGEGSFNAANDYCTRHGLKDGTVWVLVAQDFVRRAKALAERGQ